MMKQNIDKRNFVTHGRTEPKEQFLNIQKHAKGHTAKNSTGHTKKMDEKCQEIDVFQNRSVELNVHKKVREVTGKFKKKMCEIL